MKALAVGDKIRYDELAIKLAGVVEPTHYPDWDSVKFDTYDFIFDLNFDDRPNNIQHFAALQIPVFCCAVKKRLAEAVFEGGADVNCLLLGMNLIPGLINRAITEVSSYNANHEKVVGVMQQLNWEFRLVEDRVGMVTPRIVFMIINEAFFTLQEGTASVSDIDQAMKLGTNYPYGPFEWADRIGIKDVYETLDAIYRDTRDERYKICPLLKTRYLKEQVVV